MKSDVLGVAFNRVTVDEAVDRTLSRIAEGQSAYICTPNPEIVWACRKNAALRRAIDEADMTLADGIGVVWASRVLGDAPLPERVSGYDFLMALLARFEGRVFLLGGRPGVAERAVAEIERRFPAVTVAGCRDGYFQDGDEVLRTIREAAPDVILVCMGTPEQELWMQRNMPFLDRGVMIGLGGCLDVLAGDLRRAPERWIRANLEWLYRLIQQPWRLGRQLRLPLFVGAVLAGKIKKRGSKEPRD